MSVLLARSYASAASPTFLWPSVPLTTTAFTLARRIIRVRVWRKSCQPPIFTPTTAAAGCRKTAANVAGIDGRPRTGLEYPLPTDSQRTNAPDEVGVHHRVQRKQLLLFQHLHFALVNHTPDVEHVVFVEVVRLQPGCLQNRSI
jgi:hypothetical protein